MSKLATLIITIVVAITAPSATARGNTMEPAPIEGAPTLEAQMLKLYDAAGKDINKLASRAFAELAENPERKASQFRQIRASQLAVQIERRVNRLGTERKIIMRGPARNAINSAIQRANKEMAAIGFDRKQILPQTQFGFAVVNSEAVEVIAQDTLDKTTKAIDSALDDGIRKHAASATGIFRKLGESSLTIENPQAEAQVNRAIARGLITGNTTIADRAIRQLYQPAGQTPLSVRKLGNQIITVGKANMTVRQYAATVTRTRMREATVTARHRQMSSRGMNLVQVVGNTSTNFCTAFIGLVCSLDDSTSVDGLSVAVVPLSSLPGGGPPFHPNCSKSTSPFHPSLASSSRIKLATNASATYITRKSQGRVLSKVK